jgi:hypothetical protein
MIVLVWVTQSRFSLSLNTYLTLSDDDNYGLMNALSLVLISGQTFWSVFLLGSRHLDVGGCLI